MAREHFPIVQIQGQNNTAVVTGLCVSWIGTALLASPLARPLSNPSQLATALLGQALFWALAAAILVSVLLWEKQSLRSLWLKRFRWQSVTWGLLLIAIYYTMLFPLGEWLRRSVGLPGLGIAMDRLTKFPLWYRVVAVMGGAVSEEVLFRGFSVTRLAMLTGHTWLAAVVSLVGFVALHVPLWGWGFALGGLVSGAAAMTFFIWRRDLLALIIFHLATDGIGLVVAPLFSEWWKSPDLF